MSSIIKCVVYDFDGTLFGESLFVEGEKVLKAVQIMGIKQSMATFNPHASFYIQRYGLQSFFDKVCSGRKKDHKLGYLKSIIKHYNDNKVSLDETEVLFVDDDSENIQAVQKMTGINCIQVDPKKGITFKELQAFIPSLKEE